MVVVLELCDVGSLRDCLQGELLAGHDVEVAVEQQQQQQLLLKQLKQVQQHKELECAGAGAGGERGVTTRPEAGGEGTGTRAVAETAAAAAEGLSGSVYDNPLATAWFSRAQPHPHARVVALLALQVARGVAYLHSSGVVHCALSSANVLLKRAGAGGGAPEGPDASTSGGDGRSRTGGEGGGGVVAQGQQFWCSYVAKVADFGLVGRLQAPCGDGDGRTHVCGAHRQPSLYTAPELALYGRASFAADAYAFAVLLWELAHGRALPELLTRPEGAAAREWLSRRHRTLLQGQAGMEEGMGAAADAGAGAEEGRREAVGVGPLPADALVWPEGTPAGCVELAGECLREEPEQRPSFEGICGRLESVLQELCGS